MFGKKESPWIKAPVAGTCKKEVTPELPMRLVSVSTASVSRGKDRGKHDK